MMVNLLRISVDWLKMAWARQPVLVISCAMGVIGPLFVVLGPGTAKGELERREWPTHYDRKAIKERLYWQK